MESNIIFIGKKNFINYIKAIETVFEKDKKLNQVIIKARGKFISKAVDLAVSVVNKRFCKELNLIVNKINIGSSENKVEGRDKPLIISNIEITLLK